MRWLFVRPLEDVASFMQPTGREMYQVIRARRSFTLRKIIFAAIQAAREIVRRAHARHRQRQEAKAVHDTLWDLDDRTLRDLGFDRSEITSVAAEVTGAAERTRVRALLMSHTLP
ncbi:MAG: DUF1127 domain-containing protein [Betaproteobacteria bacterium]|nr:MAG: DUF1127 domain-containing protein [Betaproteobacteria bacterium]